MISSKSHETGRGRAWIGRGLRAGSLAIGVAMTGLIASSTGCNIVGPAFLMLHGPAKIPAVFELDGNRTTVILIDDLSNRVPRRSLRDQMGRVADEELLRKGVIEEGNLISSVSARRAASSDTSESHLSAVDVARKVGAEVIIYVTMTGWTLRQDPGFLSPAAGAEVRILDAVSNQRLWPVGERTYPFVARMQRQSGDLGMSLSEKAKWEQALAAEFGTELAKLFYTHEKESLSQQMRPGLN